MKKQLSQSFFSGIATVVTTLSLIMATPAVVLSKGHKPPPPKGQGRPDKIVLRVDLSQGDPINSINDDYSTTTLEAIANIPGAYVVKTQDGSDAQKALGKMQKDRRLIFAEVDMLTESVDANPHRIGAWGMLTPPEYVNQDAVPMLGLPQAQAITRGAGTIVAILDTGVQLDHPGLAGSLVQGYDFVDDDAVPQDVPNGQDDNRDGRVDEVFGHGTHVAGIIHLVAPDAKIMPLRVLDADGIGSVIDLAEAISYAVQHGANVINVSLGTSTPSALLNNVVDEASSRGVLVVASAGNLDSEAEQYPAADDCAVGVTSINAADARSPFSSFGKWVDFSAPGEAIYSTFPPNGYAHWSGTSMATPFVAGQIALIRSAAPQFSIRDVVKVMQNSAVQIDKLKENKHEKNRLGIGRIDIGASVQMAATGRVDQSGPKKIKGGCLR